MVSATSGEALQGGQQMSEACVSGTVQLPPDGNPVILLAEHQTTGGYAVPAAVIQADLWKVGQMRVGETLRFVRTTRAEATAALQQLHAQAAEVRPRAPEQAEFNLALLAAGVNQLGGGDEHVQAGESMY